MGRRLRLARCIPSREVVSFSNSVETCLIEGDADLRQAVADLRQAIEFLAVDKVNLSWLFDKLNVSRFFERVLLSWLFSSVLRSEQLIEIGADLVAGGNDRYEIPSYGGTDRLQSRSVVGVCRCYHRSAEFPLNCHHVVLARQRCR